MSAVAKFLRQRFCSHEVYIEDIVRQTVLTNDLYHVEAPCHRCGAKLTAPYGLALKANLAQRPKEQP
jgi:hypothetical protein